MTTRLKATLLLLLTGFLAPAAPAQGTDVPVPGGGDCTGPADVLAALGPCGPQASNVAAPCGIKITGLLTPQAMAAAPEKPCGLGVPPVENPCDTTSICNIEVCEDGGADCLLDYLQLLPCGGSDEPPCKDYACSGDRCNIAVCEDGGIDCLLDYLQLLPCGGSDEPSCQDYACSGDRCNVEVCEDGGIDCIQDYLQALPCGGSDEPSCLDYVCSRHSALQGCDPDLPEPCRGGSYGVEPNCHTVGVGECPGGYGIAVDGGILASCIQTPDPCPSGSYGVNGDCHTVGVGECPGGYGVVVDGGILASCVQARLCPSGSYGANGLCHTVGPCDPGETGAKVDGSELACVPTPGGCPPGSYGAAGSCHTVGSCDAGSTGVKVDGSALTCVPTGMLCPGGSYGVQPSCHTVGPCDSGAVGQEVDGSPAACVDTPIAGCRSGTSVYQGKYGAWCASAAEIAQDSIPDGEVPLVFDDEASAEYAAGEAKRTGIELAHPMLVSDPGANEPPPAGLCSEGVGVVLGDKPFCRPAPVVDTDCPPRHVGVHVESVGTCVPVPPIKILWIDETGVGDAAQEPQSAAIQPPAASASASSSRDCSRSACAVVFVMGFTGANGPLPGSEGPVAASYDSWAPMIDFYQERGYTAYGADYYGGACGPLDIRVDMADHGDHGVWMSNHHSDGNGLGCNGGAIIRHDRDTDYRHMAYHLAQWLHDRFGTQPIDIVAHSMGGLIVRYAMAMATQNTDAHGVNPLFPLLNVQDVVTMGTPHGGVNYAPCGDWGWAGYTQTRQMSFCSGETKWLKAHAQDPQGMTGTDWTVMGADDDGAVSSDSARAMAAMHKVRYPNDCCEGTAGTEYDHTDYYHDTRLALDGRAEWQDGDGPEYMWNGAPHSVYWAYLASTRPDW